jgi:hypothetical protein
MDHILEHEGQSVPSDLSTVSESSAGAAIEGDDEDADALRSLGADASGAVEAKVRLDLSLLMCVTLNGHTVLRRASNALNAARYSGIQRLQITMRRRADMISSRNQRKRFVQRVMYCILLRDKNNIEGVID